MGTANPISDGQAPMPVTDAAPLDAVVDSAPAMPCTWTDFGEPEALQGLAVVGDAWGPSLAADGRTLYFAVNDGADEEIMMATRTDGGVVFGAASPVPNVQSSSLDGTPFISDDALSLYFFSSRNGSRDLWVATRSSPSASFDTPALVPVVNSTNIEQHPRLAPNGFSLSLSSDRTGTLGGLDIWVAERSSPSGDFDTPSQMTDLSSDSLDSGATFSRDGLLAILTSNRPVSAGFDLWMATRSTKTDLFDPPENLTVANSPSTEADPMLSRDDRELFFVSSRGGARELWRSVRQCL